MPGPLWQQVGQLFNTIYLLLDEELNKFTVKFLFVWRFDFSPKARTAYFEPSCILLKKINILKATVEWRSPHGNNGWLDWKLACYWVFNNNAKVHCKINQWDQKIVVVENANVQIMIKDLVIPSLFLGMSRQSSVQYTCLHSTGLIWQISSFDISFDQL